MGVPATTGVLRGKIQDMEVGDYIACKYVASSGAVGVFSELGTSTATEIPVAGSATPNGSFYLVKVDKGLLIADRVVQHSITWDVLNAGKFIQGVTQTFQSIAGIIRSLSGGVAYADANGNLSTTDQNLGAFPTNNEWDKYIVNFPANKIQTEKTLDDIFHWKSCLTVCQDTIALNTVLQGYKITDSIRRSERGGANPSANYLSYRSTSVSSIGFGFRPVFSYNELLL